MFQLMSAGSMSSSVEMVSSLPVNTPCLLPHNVIYTASSLQNSFEPGWQGREWMGLSMV